MATAKKATKSAKEASEVKTLDQLREDLAAKQQDLVDARRSHRAGELVNPRVITTTRKQIARLHTAIRVAEVESKESK